MKSEWRPQVRHRLHLVTSTNGCKTPFAETQDPRRLEEPIASRPMEGSQTDERVKPLELFFDLVFVFGLTQVTSLLSAHPTWAGLFQGILVLGAIWWAWAAYAWLTNTLNPEEGIVRIAMFVVMAAMLVVALAVPEAFDEHGVIFGFAYLIVRTMHLALYALAARGDPRPPRRCASDGAVLDDQRRPHHRRRLRRG